MPAPYPALDKDRLAAALPRECLVGRRIQIFAETDSTNNLARDAGEAGAPEGLVFLAEAQRSGRGQRGRTWTSPAGCSLLFSLLLRPSAPRELWSRLTLLAVRSILEAVEIETGIAVAWKWPNDVVLGPRKLAGILVEAAPNLAVLGIGVNVKQREADFPEDLRARAASLEMIAGRALDRESLAAAILSAIDRHYRADWSGESFSAVRDYCVGRSALKIGDAVRVRHGDAWAEGTLVGFTKEAHLRIASAGGVIDVAGGLLQFGIPNAEVRMDDLQT
jgi:BirA family biotin operon repressor/biotin-[acetyl-CoA-carboxylase] ligase